MPIVEIRTVAFDYSGTITEDGASRVDGVKPVSADAVRVLRALHGSGVRLVLASNTLPSRNRLPALESAGAASLFAAVLQSHRLGYGKPAPAFYADTLTAARCSPQELLYVGNNLAKDAVGPVAHGFRAALLRPDGLGEGEALPVRAVMIRALDEVPSLVEHPGRYW